VAFLKCRDIAGNAAALLNPRPDPFPDLGGDEFSFADAVDGFSLMVCIAGDIIHVSSNVARVIGLTPVELLGRAIRDFVHPADHGKLGQLCPDVPGQDVTHVEVGEGSERDRGREIGGEREGESKSKRERAITKIMYNTSKTIQTFMSQLKGTGSRDEYTVATFPSPAGK
jgi:PAS domain S-box-containing protein